MPWRSAAPLVAQDLPGPQQPFEHGRPGPARGGVGGHPRRLVHHDDVGVLVHHVQAGHGAWHRRGGHRGGQRDVQPLPRGHPVRLGRGPATDQDLPVGDQFRGARPGQPEHTGQRGVDPFTVQPVRHRHPALARPGHGGAVPGWAGRGRPVRPGRAAVLGRAPRARRHLADRGSGPVTASFTSLAGRGGTARPGGLVPAAVQGDSPGGQQHGQHATAHDGRVGHVEHRPVRQLDPVHHVAAQEAGRPEEPVPEVPVAPPSSSPSVIAQGMLRSRRAVRRMATMTPRAIRVKTTVTDVPMLNAAPLLRSSRSVSRPPSSRRGARSDRVATTMVLGTRSATKTATAMMTRSRTGRGRGAGPGLTAAP